MPGMLRKAGPQRLAHASIQLRSPSAARRTPRRHSAQNTGRTSSRATDRCPQNPALRRQIERACTESSSAGPAANRLACAVMTSSAEIIGRRIRGPFDIPMSRNDRPRLQGSSARSVAAHSSTFVPPYGIGLTIMSPAATTRCFGSQTTMSPSVCARPIDFASTGAIGSSMRYSRIERRSWAARDSFRCHRRCAGGARRRRSPTRDAPPRSTSDPAGWRRNPSRTARAPAFECCHARPSPRARCGDPA